MFSSDGVLDIDGGQLKNARVENVDALPTTTYGNGRNVFYNNSPFWWDGTKWLTLPPVTYRTLYIDVGYPNVYPYFSSVANAQTYARANFATQNVLFDIYSTAQETITFNSSDNYYLTMRYNIGTANLDRGSLIIDSTYVYPFVIDGHGTFAHLHLLGGSQTYTSTVHVAEVTSQAIIYTKCRLYAYIGRSKYIDISASVESQSSPQSAVDFHLSGEYCFHLDVSSGGTTTPYIDGKWIVDIKHISWLSYFGTEGGEYHFNCKIIDNLSIKCGDCIVPRDTYVYINGARITGHTKVSGHYSTPYYLYAYFRGCSIDAGSAYDNAMFVAPSSYTKIFIDHCTFNAKHPGQYGIEAEIDSDNRQRTYIYLSYSKVISTAASIYNPNSALLPVVAQYSTCRQAISGGVSVTGTLTQNTEFF